MMNITREITSQNIFYRTRESAYAQNQIFFSFTLAGHVNMAGGRSTMFRGSHVSVSIACTE